MATCFDSPDQLAPGLSSDLAPSPCGPVDKKYAAIDIFPQFVFKIHTGTLRVLKELSFSVTRRNSPHNTVSTGQRARQCDCYVPALVSNLSIRALQAVKASSL